MTVSELIIKLNQIPDTEKHLWVFRSDSEKGDTPIKEINLATEPLYGLDVIVIK